MDKLEKSGNTALQSASASSLSSEASRSQSVKTIMLGRFRIVALLGEGAMGRVMRAEDTKLKRHVALKCLKKRAGENAARDEQFIREARSAATLDHPAIVQIYEVGEGGGYNYIAMELIEGGNLGTMLKACGPLDVTRACQLCAEAADGLAYAAQMGVTHRDIKPENLMLTRAGRCKITDFGLARIEDPSDSFSMPVGAIGTPAYMAPEVVQGQPATDKSDVYSLGAVMYRLLTAKPPFPAKDRQEAMRLQVEGKVPDVRALAPQVPESLSKVIMRALAKNPGERPNAQTFATQLRAHTISPESSQIISNGSGMFATTVPQATPPSRWMLVGSLVGGTIAAVVVVIVTMLMMRQRTPVAPGVVAASTPVAINAAEPVSSLQAEVASVNPVSVRADGASTKSTAAPVRNDSPAVTFPEGVAPVTHKVVVIAASETLDASDIAGIILAAQAQKNVAIKGTIGSFAVDASFKNAVLHWVENPQLVVTYPQRLFGSMTKHFGGRDGSGIQNKQVSVTGTLTLVGSLPTLTLSSSSQVQLTK